MHVEPGNIIRTGPNLYPHFEVIAVHDQTVWVRNTDTGVDCFAVLERCQPLPTEQRQQLAA